MRQKHYTAGRPFINETKQYTGWIFEPPADTKWIQQIYRVKNRFQNPLHQNYGHLKAVQDIFTLTAWPIGDLPNPVRDLCKRCSVEAAPRLYRCKSLPFRPQAGRYTGNMPPLDGAGIFFLVSFLQICRAAGAGFQMARTERLIGGGGPSRMGDDEQMQKYECRMMKFGEGKSLNC